MWLFFFSSCWTGCVLCSGKQFQPNGATFEKATVHCDAIAQFHLDDVLVYVRDNDNVKKKNMVGFQCNCQRVWDCIIGMGFWRRMCANTMKKLFGLCAQNNKKPLGLLAYSTRFRLQCSMEISLIDDSSFKYYRVLPLLPNSIHLVNRVTSYFNRSICNVTLNFIWGQQ